MLHVYIETCLNQSGEVGLIFSSPVVCLSVGDRDTDLKWNI